MTIQQLLMLALQTSILLTVFGFGLQATLDDVLHLLRRPSLLGRSLAAMFLFMPVLAVAMARAFNLMPAVEIALMALAISPVPPLLLKKEDKAGGQASYGLGLMAIFGVLSIVIVPVGARILGEVFGHPFSMAPRAIARVMLTTTVLPLTAGMVCRAILPAIAKQIAKPIALVAAVAAERGHSGDSRRGATLGTQPRRQWHAPSDGSVRRSGPCRRTLVGCPTRGSSGRAGTVNGHPTPGDRSGHCQGKLS